MKSYRHRTPVTIPLPRVTNTKIETQESTWYDTLVRHDYVSNCLVSIVFQKAFVMLSRFAFKSGKPPWRSWRFEEEDSQWQPLFSRRKSYTTTEAIAVCSCWKSEIMHPINSTVLDIVSCGWFDSTCKYYCCFQVTCYLMSGQMPQKLLVVLICWMCCIYHITEFQENQKNKVLDR